jgi:hypothetical protein
MNNANTREKRWSLGSARFIKGCQGIGNSLAEYSEMKGQQTSEKEGDMRFESATNASMPQEELQKSRWGVRCIQLSLEEILKPDKSGKFVLRGGQTPSSNRALPTTPKAASMRDRARSGH